MKRSQLRDVACATLKFGPRAARTKVPWNPRPPESHDAGHEEPLPRCFDRRRRPGRVGACRVRADARVRGHGLSIDRAERTFKIRDSERGTIRVRVTNRTRFERISGFSGLKVGARNIETIVRRSNGRWVAVEVERSGGGGRHGGSDDDDSSDDRGRGRGSDDAPGDDRGGRD
jgi:hypothetical protein